MKNTIPFALTVGLLSTLSCSKHDSVASATPSGSASSLAAAPTPASTGSIPASLAKLTPNELKWGISPTRNDKVTYQPHVIIEGGTRIARADATRLATGGSGSAAPKATNATLEGRAQNRRIELTRQ